MNNYIVLVALIFLSIISCNKLKKINCDTKYQGITKHFVHSKNYSDILVTEWIEDSVIRFELSLNSTILFSCNDYSPYYSKEFYDLLNPQDTIPQRYGGDCYYCFLGEDEKTYLVALRPQKHPFIKEVAVYGQSTNNEYYIWHFYMNPRLDKLIPDSILQKYNVPFNYEELICYSRGVEAALDSIYHTTGKTLNYKKNHSHEDVIRIKVGKVKETNNWHQTLTDKKVTKKTSEHYKKYSHDFKKIWWNFSGWNTELKENIFYPFESGMQTRAVILSDDQYPFYSEYYQDTFYVRKNDSLDFMPELTQIIENINYRYESGMVIKN